MKIVKETKIVEKLQEKKNGLIFGLKKKQVGKVNVWPCKTPLISARNLFITAWGVKFNNKDNEPQATAKWAYDSEKNPSCFFLNFMLFQQNSGLLCCSDMMAPSAVARYRQKWQTIKLDTLIHTEWAKLASERKRETTIIDRYLSIRNVVFHLALTCWWQITTSPAKLNSKRSYLFSMKNEPIFVIKHEMRNCVKEQTTGTLWIK